MIEKEVLFKHLYNIEYPSIEKEVEELFELGKLIKPFLADTFSMIDKAVENDKKILFQLIMIRTDHHQIKRRKLQFQIYVLIKVQKMDLHHCIGHV